jgi:hypothetical protein
MTAIFRCADPRPTRMHALFAYGAHVVRPNPLIVQRFQWIGAMRGDPARNCRTVAHLAEIVTGLRQIARRPARSVRSIIGARLSRLSSVFNGLAHDGRLGSHDLSRLTH